MYVLFVYGGDSSCMFFGGVFQVKHLISINGNPERIPYDTPLEIAAKSYVVVKALASGGGGEVSAGFDLYYK